jgi:hypothetical protein
MNKFTVMITVLLFTVATITQAGTMMALSYAQDDANSVKTNIVVPAWIKQSAQWWSLGQISDEEFVNSIEFLITEKIIQSPRISVNEDSPCDDKPLESSQVEELQVMPESYDPKIVPSDFVSKITNKFLTFVPGTTFVYESQTEDGLERTEVTVLDEKRKVMGVDTTVVWDRVWLDGELIEDTKDWYAQDVKGNVWYFGEESKEYAGGELVSFHGSWEAGIDGAKPGIVMKASPQVGDVYQQEYYPGVAEDMGEVVSLGETVSVPHDRLYNCLKTKDWNPLEPGVTEFKYYCPDIGSVALEENPDDQERVELVAVGSDVLMTDITEKEAMEIALNEVPGTVTDIVKEGFRGKFAYAVEIRAENGIEIDVFVDIKTGKVLGTEQ